jgi:hypothetical protein
MPVGLTVGNTNPNCERDTECISERVPIAIVQCDVV